MRLPVVGISCVQFRPNPTAIDPLRTLEATVSSPIMKAPVTSLGSECGTVQVSLHPRTAFMIVVPATILAVLVALVLLSPHAGKAGVLQGIAAVAGVSLVAIVAALWEQKGRFIRWDQHGVSLRQVSRLGITGTNPIFIPYEVIERIELAGMPRGITPTRPHIAIVTKASRNGRFIIDPNYYKAGSLLDFFQALSQHSPQVKSANEGIAFHRVINRLERAL